MKFLYIVNAIFIEYFGFRKLLFPEVETDKIPSEFNEEHPDSLIGDAMFKQRR